MTRARAGSTRTADTTGSRAGGRPRDPALDEAIILATRARLVRDGYSRMTLGDIAADAGVSRPTLYRRWDTKLELVADALDYGFRKQRDQYDIDLSRLAPREAFVEAVRRLDPAYFNPDAMVLMGNFAGEVIHTPELLEMLREHAVEPRVTLVENVLSQLQTARGRVRGHRQAHHRHHVLRKLLRRVLPRRPQGGDPRECRRRAVAGDRHLTDGHASKPGTRRTGRWRHRSRSGAEGRRLDPGHLAERAGDAHRQRPEVDCHCRHFHVDDATHPVGVVGHEIVDRELLDDRLGIRLEGARGQVASWPR